MAEKEKSRGGIDLFKVIMVGCGLASIVFLVLNVIQYKDLAHTKDSYNKEMNCLSRLRATVETINQLKSKREIFKTDMDLRSYLESNIQEGASIGTDSFTIEQGRAPRLSKKGYKDQVMKIAFHQQSGEKSRRNKNLPLSRSQIFAMVFNVESQNPQVKLYEFEMDAVEATGRSTKEDPRKLSDQWYVRRFDVVKRSPAKVKKPR